jgi:hypothetical protein
MAYDWKKIIELFQVMGMSSGYPSHQHIFAAAQKELDEVAPKPKGMAKPAGQYAPNESTKPIEQQGPLPSSRAGIPPIPPDDRLTRRQ